MTAIRQPPSIARPSTLPTSTTSTTAATTHTTTTTTQAPAAPSAPSRVVQTAIGAVRDVVPHQQKPAAAGTMSVFAARLGAKTTTKAWDPVGRLPASLQARLGPADLAAIAEAVATIQQQVQQRGLSYVPVFGYLSLRTINAAELGVASQADVVPGKHIVDAFMPDHAVDVVASTVFRGTPEHPGAVAGLRQQPGERTPGSMLKVPVERAEELLAVLLAREMFAEGDLVDGAHGSNAMYTPTVRDVVVDGDTIPAFVFVTNTQGAKALTAGGTLGDDVGLDVGRMAWLFASSGGFVDDNGVQRGGKAIDYWQASYASARAAAQQPIDPTIAEAIDRARLMPQQAVVDRLLARRDDDAKLMVQALAVLFAGAVSPLSLVREQKPTSTLVRQAPAPTAEDHAAVARLLAKAKQMAAAGEL
jgi:hypothetical protein